MTGTDLEVRRRERLAVPLRVVVYIGIPVVFLALTHLINAAHVDKSEHLTYNYQVLGFPALMIAVGLWTFRSQRYRTMAWPTAGAWYAGVTGTVSAFHTIVLDGAIGEMSSYLIAVTLLSTGVGWLVGYGARRVISHPPGAGLARSGYEFGYRLRGARNMRLRIGPDTVAVEETIIVRGGTGSSRRTQGPSFPVASVSQVACAEVGDRTPMSLPWNFRTSPRPQAGPAVVFRVASGDWRVPVDHAEGVAALLERRAAAARTTHHSRPSMNT